MLSSTSIAGDICPSWTFIEISGRFFGIGILAVSVTSDTAIFQFSVEADFTGVLLSVVEFFSHVKVVITEACLAIIVTIFELKFKVIFREEKSLRN